MIKHDPTIPSKDSEILATARWDFRFRRYAASHSRHFALRSKRFTAFRGHRWPEVLRNSLCQQAESVRSHRQLCCALPRRRSIDYLSGRRSSRLTENRDALRETFHGLPAWSEPGIFIGLIDPPWKMEHAKVSQFRSDRNLAKRSFHGDGVPFPVIRPIQPEAEGLVTERFAYSGFFFEGNNLVRMFLNKRRSYPRLRSRNFNISRKFSGCRCWIVNFRVTRFVLLTNDLETNNFV